MSLTKMDVDTTNNVRRPLSDEASGVNTAIASQRSQEVRRKIEEQVIRIRRLRGPSDPLVCELLVPCEMAKSTFCLPAVEKLLREFLPLEEAVNQLLAPQVNWAPPGYKPDDSDVHDINARLWALRTDGDGDCLLHAVSLSLWGEHDRSMVLRELVVAVLGDKPSEKRLFQLWRDGQLRADAAAGGNASFEMEEDQVVAEWNMLVQAAKTRTAYLSSFHTFVLANVLRRPIIVYGDRFVRGKNGEPYAPSDMRGVYLPTLIHRRVCHKIPLVVGYTCVAVGKVGHFTALVGIEGELLHLPLVDEHGHDLPVRYGVPRSSETKRDPDGELMEAYMNTLIYTTQEGEKYRMANVDGAQMTVEAENIRDGMADDAETAFERLTKAQADEINLQLTGAPNGSAADRASSESNTTRPLFSLDAETITSPLAPLAFAGATCTNRTGKTNGIARNYSGSRSPSPGSDMSDGPTADSFVKRTASAAAESEQQTRSQSQLGVGTTVTSLRGGAGGAEGAGGEEVRGLVNTAGILAAAATKADNEAEYKAEAKDSVMAYSHDSPADTTPSGYAVPYESNGVLANSNGVSRKYDDNDSADGPEGAASLSPSARGAARTLLLSSKHFDPVDYAANNSINNGDRRVGLDAGDRPRRASSSENAASAGAKRTLISKSNDAKRSDGAGFSNRQRSSVYNDDAEGVGHDAGVVDRYSRHKRRTESSSPPTVAAANGSDGRKASVDLGGTADKPVDPSSFSSVSRFLPGLGLLSSSVGVLSSVGAWASRRSSGRLSRESSSSNISNNGEVTAGREVSDTVGDSFTKYARKPRDKEGSSMSPSDVADKAGLTTEVNGVYTSQSRGENTVESDLRDSFNPALRDEHTTSTRQKADRYSGRRSRGESGSMNPGNSDNSVLQRAGMASRSSSGDSEEPAGTWESDMKLALSMDLVESEGANPTARNLPCLENVATDVMDGGESSSGSNKRKPDSSPACTPDGPSPTGAQEAQPDFGYPGADSTTMEEEEEPEQARNRPLLVETGGAVSRSDIERHGSSQGLSWHSRRGFGAKEKGDLESRSSNTMNDACSDATPRTLATERWRSLRSGSGVGAGSRRGQPHPRGDELEGASGGSSDRCSAYDTQRRLDSGASSSESNPWLGKLLGVSSTPSNAAASIARARHQRNHSDRAVRKNNRSRLDEEHSHESVAGPEFESAWADTDFGSVVATTISNGLSRRQPAETRHAGTTSRVEPSEHHPKVGNGDLRMPGVILNDRILGRDVGASKSSGLTNGGSRVVEDAGQSRSARESMLAVRYPYAQGPPPVPVRTGSREFNDPHYKTLAELKQERVTRQKMLDGKGNGVGVTASGDGRTLQGKARTTGVGSTGKNGVESEGSRHHDSSGYDLPPEPAPTRSQLALKARRSLDSTSALANGSHSGRSPNGAAQPPSPPPESPHRPRSFQMYTKKNAATTLSPRPASLRNRRSGSASYSSDSSRPPSNLSPFDLHEAARLNRLGHGTLSGDYFEEFSRGDDYFDEATLGVDSNLGRGSKRVSVSRKDVVLDGRNSVISTLSKSPDRNGNKYYAESSLSSRPSPSQSWKADSLRRKIETGKSGEGSGANRPSSPAIRSRQAGSPSSGRSNGSFASTSAASVPAAVARGMAGGNGVPHGARGVRYEQQTLSSLRRSQAVQDAAEGIGSGLGRRANSTGNGGFGSQGGYTRKFY